ncbi:TonB-dependent receptor [Flavobacteriaceae bacterium F89]|uniref:TonB-dependent receptor n=1 Tax=Cerina litoralis TaxID=2874477 RepID=A0AAE3JSC9_9FLAO|nr:TonB-dependent receptor [Cerina litoralis]MCG2462358.1 TonB-dependent receptor [Cerina litoralis]
MKRLFNQCYRNPLRFRFSYAIILAICLILGFSASLTASSGHSDTGLSTSEKFSIQNIVTGTVTDKAGQSLPGASILEKGTTNGVVADFNGNFSISISSSDAILVVSYVGFAEQEIAVNGKSYISIILEESAESLDEVVLIGYGSVSKSELTGSAQTITSADFQTGSITSPEQSISGKVAGVSITPNSGQPGTGSKIRIRGGASINASNNPLIVIDGVPQRSENSFVGGVTYLGDAPIDFNNQDPLSLINPNDIESFTILKDAASTAIYGSRASNGVILITTKKGVKGKPKFSFSSKMAFISTANRYNVLSTDEFRGYVNGYPDMTTGSGETYVSLLGNADTDWQDQIFHTGVTLDNNFNASGSLGKLQYRASLGYLNQQSVLKTDNLKRYSGALNLGTLLFNDHLKIDMGLKRISTDNQLANTLAISSAIYFDPTQPVTKENGEYWEWDTRTPESTWNTFQPRNPVGLLEQYNNQADIKRTLANLQMDYKFHFLPELRANLNLGIDNSNTEGNVFVPEEASSNRLTQGLDQEYQTEFTNSVAEFYLDYNKDLQNLNSKIDATLGYGFYDFKNTNYFFPRYNAVGEIIPGTEPVFDFDNQENSLLSYYGRFIYTYNSRYIVSGTLRRDSSSRFSEQNRTGYFPSIAATWRINQENFLKNSNTLSDLKLRLSYGQTGNQDGIPNYGYLKTMLKGTNGVKIQMGDEFVNFYATRPFNLDLKWERTETYNLGFDYGFFKNRLNGSLDVYLKKTSDLLNVIPIPSGTNFAPTLLSNVGNLENRGVEFSINAIPIETGDSRLDMNFNITYNTNEITKLTASNDPSFIGNIVVDHNNALVQINSVGYPINSFFVFKQKYDQDNKPIFDEFEDLNNDGKISELDRYHSKSPDPIVFLGFSTTYSWKKFSLGTVLRANLGNYVFNQFRANSLKSRVFNASGFLANVGTEILQNDFPTYSTNQVLSDLYLENASFLKMDNLFFSYDVGTLFGNRTNLLLNANVQNVFVITGFDGVDPELASGIYNNGFFFGKPTSNMSYPFSRIFNLGVTLNF